MKILVAGGTGFLGKNIVRILEKKGENVIICSRQTGIDIRDFNQIDNFLEKEKPDIIINCAALVGGIAYNAQCPIRIYEDNLLIGFNLVKAATNRIKKLVNVMPNCTYPGVASIYSENIWWDGPMDETVLTYGMPRKALWVQTWAYAKENKLKSIHLVLPNLYGPEDHFDPIRSHAIGALIKKIVDAKLNGDKKVIIWGTGKVIREWMYVEDAAEGIVAALNKYDSIEILNLGWGKGWTIIETAEYIKRAVGWEGEFVFDLSKPDGAPKKILDVSRMHSLLGWRPKVDIEEGIRRTVKWYLDKISEEKKLNEK